MAHSTDHIFHTAITTEGMNRKEVAMFHLYNPNGAYQEYLNLSREVLASVERGEVKGGFLIAYDPDYHVKKLTAFAQRKKGGSVWHTHYHVDCIRELTIKLRVAHQKQLG